MKNKFPELVVLWAALLGVVLIAGIASNLRRVSNIMQGWEFILLAMLIWFCTWAMLRNNLHMMIWLFLKLKTAIFIVVAYTVIGIKKFIKSMLGGYKYVVSSVKDEIKKIEK